MIGPDFNADYQQPGQVDNSRQTLTMVRNERMAGSIASWSKSDAPFDKVLQRLADASAPDNSPGNTPSPYQNAMRGPQESGYSNSQAEQNAQAFGAGDIIDMINPLQHIPVVGHIYRDITGDQIKPIAQILGGALFGGALGAGAGLVNMIAKAETGDDLAGHAMRLVKRSPDISPPQSIATPEMRLAKATQNTPDETLSNAVLSFSNLGEPNNNDFRTQRLSADEMAYKGARPDINNVPAREAITELTLAAAPRIKPTYNT